MKYKITAQRLRDALHSKGLKAQELANLAQINKASVSHYLGGSHKPSNINAGKMAQVLGVDPLYLMGFDVPPKGIEQKKLDETFSEFEIELISRYRAADNITQEIVKRALELDKAFKKDEVQSY